MSLWALVLLVLLEGLRFQREQPVLCALAERVCIYLYKQNNDLAGMPVEPVLFLTWGLDDQGIDGVVLQRPRVSDPPADC